MSRTVSKWYSQEAARCFRVTALIPLNTDEPTDRLPFITVLLILVNVLVFAVWQQEIGMERAVRLAALVPARMTAHAPGAFEQLWLSLFMHGSWMHLIGNMWFLWIFGCNIEDLCGATRYLCFYLSCGVISTFAHIYGDPHSTLPLVGASGAISGVLGAYLLQFPHAKVRMLFFFGFFPGIIRFRAYFFLLFWILIQVGSQLVSRVAESRGGVAYLAHVGGFIAGMILIPIFRKPEPAYRTVRYAPE